MFDVITLTYEYSPCAGIVLLGCTDIYRLHTDVVSKLHTDVVSKLHTDVVSKLCAAHAQEPVGTANC